MRRKQTFEFTGCFDISSEIPHGVIAIDNFEQFHPVLIESNHSQQTSSSPRFSSMVIKDGDHRKEKRRASQQQHNGFSYYQYYFLSHFHSDHFKGLHDKFFQYAAASEETCIKFTNHATHEKENNPQNHLSSNKVNNSSSRSQVKNFTVTLLSSNHCPGSVMFLFEIQKGTQKESILYTGDFRNVSIETTTFLKTQKLTKIYIDDTFCDESNFSELPTRSNSIRNIISLIEKERQRHKIVYMALDLLGTERILFEIEKHFKCKIYLDYENLNPKRRKEIDAMDALKEKVFTSNKDETFLRVVSKDTLKSLANLLLKEADKPLFIQVSTMWLKYLNKETCGMAGKSEDATCKLTNDGIWKVLYSFHSSRNEMLLFLASILTYNTTRSIPSIISLNPQSKHIRGLIESLKQQMAKKPSVSTVENDSFDYSFFETSAELFKEEFITFSHSSLTSEKESFPSQSYNEDTQPRSQSSNHSDQLNSPVSNSYTISSLETEPYSAIPDEVFDPEQLFSLISQGQDEEERTPITQSQSLSFLNSPFTPETTPSSTKKRALNASTINTPSNGKDESFTMLDLSEDDTTPQKDCKKVKLNK
nr:unnamed protein product [Naegleria fowleri]